MKYLIKDLSKITGLSAARIRKWQERYKILKPESGSNGYHYYSNEDLLVLNHIKRSLNDGLSLSQVVNSGRENILNTNLDQQFTKHEITFIQYIANFTFEEIAKIFNREYKKLDFKDWVETVLVKHIETVGIAWSTGYLSVADEHAFSRWFNGYFKAKIEKFKVSSAPEVLVVVYPKDEHELGALLHYGLLLSEGVSAKFCGNLPEEEIYRELHAHDYQRLSVSVVIPRKASEIANFEKRIKSRFAGLKIEIGGSGVQAKAAQKRVTK